MGRLSAEGMAAAFATPGSPDTGLRAFLEWHLQHNNFPPVPLAMVPAARIAMHAIRCGLPDSYVQLPFGVTFRNSSMATAQQIMDTFHLWDGMELVTEEVTEESND